MNPKYTLDSKENKEFLRQIRDELLAFGHQFPAPGGSAYYLGDDGSPMKERARETYETCRMAHVYSIGAMLGHEGSERLADEAIRALNGEMYDAEHGGWYNGLDANDQPLPDKLCYVHAFVILAASSALLIGRPHAKELLDKALRTYDEKFWNEKEGLSCDLWNTEFTVLDDYRGLNANMHTVEAFLAVADCAGLEEYRTRAGRIIRRVSKWAENNSWRIPEHYTCDWQPDLERNIDKPDDPFKPYGATPGHGIEWSRLILQWALSSPDSDARDYIEVSKQLFERAVSDAWNADGAPGIAYTTDWNGTPFVHDRMHWTLCEAINSAAVLAHTADCDRYRELYSEFMSYMDDKVLDHKNGSFYHQLDRNNHVAGTVWPGKPDIYHALQAMMIPYLPVNVSIAKAVFEMKSK